MRSQPIVLRLFCSIVVVVVAVVVLEVAFVVVVVPNVDVVAKATSKAPWVVGGWWGGVQSHFFVKPNSVELI